MDCIKRNKGWLCIICLVFCLFLGVSLLAFHGGPKLRNYLQEEKHHVTTKCTLKHLDTSEIKECTYTNIDDEEGDFSQVKNKYLCIKARVSYVHSDDYVIKTYLFRSYQEAKDSDYQCGAYNCEDPNEVLDFAAELKEEKSFECYYNPDESQYVYMESGSSNLGWIIVSFIFELLLVVVSVTIITCCCIYVNCCKKRISSHSRRIKSMRSYQERRRNNMFSNDFKLGAIPPMEERILHSHPALNRYKHVHAQAPFGTITHPGMPR